MMILKYDTPQEALHLAASSGTGKPCIFLAGPTVRGNQPHLTSWRRDAEKEFERQGYDGILIVPEFQSKTESDKGRFELPPWEFEGLKLCDVIMFWICRTRELIGLTTSFEFGYWMARCREKMIYGRPNDAYRIHYYDIMWELDSARDLSPQNLIHARLETTVEAAISLAKKRVYSIPQEQR